MTVNLSDLGKELLGWLTYMEEERDTSKLQAQVKASCCEKPCENRQTAMGTLVDLSDLLAQHGFLKESSELQVLIARKVDELAKGPVAAAAASTTQPPAKKTVDEQPAAVKAAVSDERARKIALINHEKQEIAEELQEAEKQTGDDEEIRALRKEHFAAYTEALNRLLAKVEAAKDLVLPQAPAAEARQEAAAPSALPAQEEKKKSDEPAAIAEPATLTQKDLPAAAAKEEKKEAAPIEEKKAPKEKGEIDPELIVEIADREEEIAALQAELAVEQTDGDARLAATLAKKLSDRQKELADLKASCS